MLFCTCLGQRGQVPKHLEATLKKPVGVCAETPACDWRAHAVVAKQSSSSCAKSELLVGSKKNARTDRLDTHISMELSCSPYLFTGGHSLSDAHVVLAGGSGSQNAALVLRGTQNACSLLCGRKSYWFSVRLYLNAVNYSF